MNLSLLRRRFALAFVAMTFLIASAELLAQKPANAPSTAKKNDEDAKKRLGKYRRRIDAEAAAGRNAAAIKIAQQMLKEAKRLYPETQYPNGTEELATAHTTLGVLLVRLPDYVAAEKHHLAAFEIRGKLYPAKNGIVAHPLLAMGHEALGDICLHTGRYAESAQHYEEALMMWRRGYPKSRYKNGHERIASALRGAADAYVKLEQFDRAIMLAKEGLEMQRTLHPIEQFPRGDASIIGMLIRVADLCQAKGDLDAAFTFANEAVTMARTIYTPIQFPDGHELLVRSIDSLASIQRMRVEGKVSEKLYEEVLAMRLKLYPPNKFPLGHPDISTTCKVLALIYQEQGRWQEAFRLHAQSLAMDFALYPASKYPKGHDMLLSSINNVGFHYRKQGHSALSLPYYDRAYRMAKDLYGDQDTPFAIAELLRYEVNLGQGYSSLGNFTRAKAYYELAYESQRRLFAKTGIELDQRNVLARIADIANCCELSGDLDQALVHYRQALKLADELFDFGNFPLGDYSQRMMRTDVAALRFAKGGTSEAAREFEQVLADLRDIYGETEFPHGHIDLTVALHNVAVSRAVVGNKLGSSDAFSEAVARHVKMFPPDSFPNGHPLWARTLRELGRFQLTQGKGQEARESIQRALKMELALLTSHMRILGQIPCNDQLDYPSAGETLELWLAATSDDGADAGDVYRYLYQWKKGARQEAEDSVQLRIARAPEELKEDFQIHEFNRVQTAALCLVDPFDRDPASWSRIDKRLAAIVQHQAALENRLEKVSEPFRIEQSALRASVEDLADRLDEGTALIDFATYRKSGSRDLETAVYVAFLVQKGKPVKRVEVGSVKAIDEGIAAWRAAMRDSPNENQADKAASNLGDLLWEPVEKNFGSGTKHVVVVPAGKLSAVPWGALPGREIGSVVLEEYMVSLVPDAPFVYEQLAMRESPAGGNVVLVGDVRYDGVPEEPYLVSERAIERAPVMPGQIWPPIPESTTEIEQIKRLAADLPVRELRSTAATTTDVCQYLSAARYAHLSTHGFYADPRLVSRFAQSARKRHNEMGTIKLAHVEWLCGRDPLALSGVVLSGASLPPRADALGLEIGDRGILTAEAIACTELTSLDHCFVAGGDTGDGDAAGGEGTLGLMRAFHVAGARHVTTTLWEQEPASRLILVTALYKGLLNERLSPVGALRAAQLFLYRNPEVASSLRSKLAEVPSSGRDQAIGKLLAAIDLNYDADSQSRSPVANWAGYVISGL